MKTKNIILGAGLTGLTTAYSLNEADRTYEIFEKSNSYGGLSSSLYVEKTLFDMGVHIFYFQKEHIRHLFLSLLNGEHTSQEKTVKIDLDGNLVNYPYQANLHGLPLERRIESLYSLFEAQRQQHSKCFNFKEWLISTYGEVISYDFLIPHNEKLMQMDLENVSTKWPERFFPQPDIKEIISGAFQNNDNQFHPNQYFLYPKTGGAGKMCDIFAENLNIQYNKNAININTISRTITFEDGDEVQYDNLISTIPLPVLLDILTPQLEVTESITHNLQYSSVVIIMVRVSHRSALSKDGVHWIYYPYPSIAFQRLSFSENFSPDNVPDGESGICLECILPPGPSYPQELEENCLDDLVNLGICDKDHVLDVNIKFFQYGYPIYHDKYDEDIKKVNNCLAPLQIKTTGRNGLWQYSNMEDAMNWGLENATCIIKKAMACIEKK
ncbi:protoporphyrinogen oxidase [Candidatus Scalindua japonica]|uniref:Protoporphyrinogen oxidase n=1 Tax=Candidatus Scalindua japonica TaxID=1284222 RepID=A0A286TWV8_9BACT|nr:FAD-dependent oxidoreductase [Candidatus Scalindua japonica]GAX60362.1 protoporphyrinogen oxidase [Candidatus Scalindua japonica]